MTIDPARRLANALGLDELGNEPHLVDPERLAGHGIEMRGELWAMMLDAKRTFDELIELLAPDERTRDEVLANRIYQQLSGAVAGSQEFTAVAKLYELDRSGASTSSSSTRRRRATPWTSSTRPTASRASSRAARCGCSSPRRGSRRASSAAGRASSSPSSSA